MEELQEIRKLAMLGAKHDVLTMDDVATLTGLSKSTIYKSTSSKTIPHYKSGGKYVYFSRGEVEKWMLKHRVKTTSELETEAATYCVTGKSGGGNG